MAKNCIGVLEPDQPLTSKPRFYLDKPTVKSLIAQKIAEPVGPRLIRMVRTTIEQIRAWIDGPIGVGMLVPFVKPRSSGDKLHYEMPMAGHKTPYQRSLRRLIHVSHRSYFSKQAIV